MGEGGTEVGVEGEYIYLSVYIPIATLSPPEWPALRWAAMRAVLMFHKTVSTNYNFWRESRAEAVSNRGPSAYQPTALPLGQTGSREDLPLVEFIYLLTCQVSYRRRLGSLLLCLCNVLRVLINSLACWFNSCNVAEWTTTNVYMCVGHAVSPWCWH